VILQDLNVDRAAFASRTGWEVKPEGACKEDRCVPLPGDAGEGPLDVRMLADRLGMALVGDETHNLWALGPESGGRALSTAQMADLELPDRHGRPFSLRSLRDTKVVMVAWASW
jgi:hypothetical protein